MNQTIKQQSKQNKKSNITVAVIALITATVILSIGTPLMSSIQDIQAKTHKYALDLPVKTEECKYDTTEGPSCSNNEFENRDAASILGGKGDEEDVDEDVHEEDEHNNEDGNLK
jgi:hypothetical protein